jgi:hypothetical protein
MNAWRVFYRERGNVVVGRGFFSEQVVAASLLVLSFVIFAVGGILYTGRAIWKWPAGEAPRYLRWERGFVMAAILAMVLGLVLLERMLEAAGDTILAPLAMVTFLIGAVVVIVAETFHLSGQEWVYGSIVMYVLLAFLAQAVFGVSLLRTGLLPGWVGWAAVVWNLAWLVVLPIVSPRDIYYPVLHHVAPLLIGIALLVRR